MIVVVTGEVRMQNGNIETDILMECATVGGRTACPCCVRRELARGYPLINFKEAFYFFYFHHSRVES